MDAFEELLVPSMEEEVRSTKRDVIERTKSIIGRFKQVNVTVNNYNDYVASVNAWSESEWRIAQELQMRAEKLIKESKNPIDWLVNPFETIDKLKDYYIEIIGRANIVMAIRKIALEKLTSLLDSLKEQMKEYEESLQATNMQVKALENEIKQLKEENKMLNALVKKLKEEKEENAKTLKDLQERLAEFESTKTGKRKRKTLTPEDKERALELFKKGYGIGTVSKIIGCSRKAMVKLRKRFVQDGLLDPSVIPKPPEPKYYTPKNSEKNSENKNEGDVDE